MFGVRLESPVCGSCLDGKLKSLDSRQSKFPHECLLDVVLREMVSRDLSTGGTASVLVAKAYVSWPLSVGTHGVWSIHTRNALKWRLLMLDTLYRSQGRVE